MSLLEIENAHSPKAKAATSSPVSSVLGRREKPESV